MKKNLLGFIIVCLCTFFGILGVSAAQQPPKPEPVKLNPEASAGVIQAENDLAAENARHQAEVKRLAELQSAYLKGAGVPKDFTQCAWDASKIVTCSKPPETAKAPK